jgi:thiamine kinase-like enzyme
MMTKIISLINKSNSLLYTNGILKVLLKDRFYKVGLGREGKARILDEYKNYSLLEQKGFKSFLPQTELKIFPLVSVLNVETLQKSEKVTEHLKQVYEKFNETSRLETLSDTIVPFLTNHFKSAEVTNVLKMISGNKIKTGLIHGDFHAGNIMATADGFPKMIDLDLTSVSWSREFDLINILVSQKILLMKVAWKKAFELSWNEESKLSDYDSLWSMKDSVEKRVLFYLYYLKRKTDEKESLISTEHSQLLGILNWGLK